MIKILAVLGSVVLSLALPTDHGTTKRQEKCGYESCTPTHPDKLNVHIVPHTHDDVGWLKTVDQYYYGSRNDIQLAGVRNILDSVVDELWKDPKRRFIFVETAFFWKWWNQQNPFTRKRVHAMVRQGRLKFIGGAWSMNDEAAVHYQSTIDQFAFGLQKLNDTFGECGIPVVGWQIDPFGHSREFTSLLAQMGYDGLFLGRIDFADKTLRMRDNEMEMIWRGDDVLGNPSDIFTGILYNRYSPPPGFCFDVLCNDEPIIDDPESPLFNVEERVNEFFETCWEQSKVYKTNNIILTMGEDFNYQSAPMWFKNLDKLIQYGNMIASQNGLNITLFYSTPDCYLKAVKDANPTLPAKQDDFFPYASDENSYWTGYFTSKPTTKYFEREGNNYLQVAKQLQVLANLDKKNNLAIDALKDAMGVMQHHDAITGTEKEHVTHDYERLLHKAVEGSLAVPRQAINKFTQGRVELNLDNCKFNESSCHTSEQSDNLVVTIYNSLVWEVTEPIRIPVTVKDESTIFEIHDAQGNIIASQMVDIPNAVKEIPTRESSANYEVVFVVTLPALGYKSYYLERKREITRKDLKSVDNKYKIDSTPTARYTLSGLTTDVKFYYYPGCYGDNSYPANRSSGAYIFRPNATEATLLDYTPNGRVSGDVVNEERGTISDVGFHAIREYKGVDFIEHDIIIGPIPIEDNIGKEYVVRYKTNLKTDGVFYTDSNARQFIERKIRKINLLNASLDEPIAGNYMPITNMIYIKSGEEISAVATDRSHGATSLDDGDIEIMLHRRLLHDDAFGVGEALDETAKGVGLVARIKQRNIVGANWGTKHRKVGIEMSSHPLVLVSDAKDLTVTEWLQFKNEFSWLKYDMPDDVHLLSLEPRGNNLLIRLENLKESGSVSVNLGNTFNNIKIDNIKETTLAANRWLKDHTQWDWNINKEFSSTKHTVEDRKEIKQDFEIELKPKQIRTFIIEYKYE